jgi:hypothetical protein
MVFAVITHGRHREVPNTVFNLVVFALAVIVAVARFSA